MREEKEAVNLFRILRTKKSEMRDRREGRKLGSLTCNLYDTRFYVSRTHSIFSLILMSSSFLSLFLSCVKQRKKQPRRFEERKRKERKRDILFVSFFF